MEEWCQSQVWRYKNRKKKNILNSENTPCIYQGKEDALAQRASVSLTGGTRSQGTRMSVLGMGSLDSPTATQEDSVESELAPSSCLHSSLCCCCESSSWAPGLVSSNI
eukprot:1160015-Pelagomonas_calceolata.AAC.5